MSSDLKSIWVPGSVLHDLAVSSKVTLASKPVRVRENVKLAPYTTLGIGGEAAMFLRASTVETIQAASDLADEQGWTLFVLGGGSNLLISDDGFNGIVLKMALRGISVIDAIDGKVRIGVAAGEDWDSFVSDCVDKGLAGVECLSGIPGLIGATPIQNVGAYGQEVSQVIESVGCYDRAARRFVTLSNADCGFAYRTSIFNTTHRGRFIVVSVTFKLQQGVEPDLNYKDLVDHFGDRRPSLAEVRKAVLKIRRSKSMVIDQKDPNSKSVGSFFKNPIVSLEKLRQLQVRYPEAPYFEFGNKVKIPAAWLIGEAGFQKGHVSGKAGISTKHNLALINRGGARAADIIALESEISDEVASRFGIRLVPEPVFIGF